MAFIEYIKKSQQAFFYIIKGKQVSLTVGHKMDSLKM